MASSSTSSSHKSFKYDVFLSFRGEDTRKTFVDHLYYALQQKSIHTYKDDEKIRKGKNISDELISSIEDSKFYIIVFTKNYASSSWCLDELVKIMECHRTTEHTAYPVFYDVEPSEVRKQSEAVEEAFAKYDEKEEAAGIWRQALKEAADLSGWVLKDTANGHEAKFIQEIVEVLSLELRSLNFNIDEMLVGMESRIMEVVSSLEADSNDVLMMGIKGMGGGGKTTLARAVFDRISFRFEGKSFVENVREVSNASLSGLKSLQNQVLSDVLNDKGINISSVHEGKNTMKRLMPNKKVLVILDDVDHIEQLEALAGKPNWFKEGSRIIITTRDEQVLVAHRVKVIRDVNLLSDKEAISLFSRYAFGKEIPVEGYNELSKLVVSYAAGLPLTVKVLGSFLCGKNELEWIDALQRLKEIPLAETMKKLEISYIGLEEDYKEIFLDVACIMKGWRKDLVIRVLESCGFHARNGLKVLQQKSLITMSAYDEYVGMHDHMEEMGRYIVRRTHPNKPHKHSRLWIEDEIEDILAKDLGTKATKCIRFKRGNTMKGLGRMKKLRFLSANFGGLLCDSESNVVGLEFPNALQYLCLHYYPFRSLPATFQANNLAALTMTSSKIVQLWEGGENRVLNKLRFLDLSGSMLSTLDLGLTPNLETLDLSKCHNLVEVHMSAGCLKLISVDLGCSTLRTLDLGLAPNLETVDLSICLNLVELHMPNICLFLRSLQLNSSKLRALDIGLTPNLEDLNLNFCYDLEELHMTNQCQKLTKLDIRGSKLRTLNLGLTPNLKTLELMECGNLVELLTPIGCLEKLAYLGLSGSLGFYSFDYILENRTLAELRLTAKPVKSCPLHPNNSLPKFQLGCFYRDVRHVLTRNLDTLISVSMCACTKLEAFCGCICRLRRLGKLKLQGSFQEAPKDLDQLECLEELIFESTSINHIPNNVCMLKHLKLLEVIDCVRLEKLPEDLGRLECLENLHLKSLAIKRLSDSICMLKHLKSLEVINCLQLEKLPEDLGQLEYLENLTFSILEIKRLPDSICMLKNLKSLTLRTCRLLENLPEDLGGLELLETLQLSYTMNIKHLPDSICMLKHLKHLQLSYCSLLEKLPEDLGQLECLERLELSHAKIRHLPNSICMLKHLKYLKIHDCLLIELPEDLGQLESLEQLYLDHCDFLEDIPNSIHMLKCLKLLHLKGIYSTDLPRSILLLKGLRIVGTIRLLRSSGLFGYDEIETDNYGTTFCIVGSHPGFQQSIHNELL